LVQLDQLVLQDSMAQLDLLAPPELVQLAQADFKVQLV
jgi:hypothetical protein